MRSAERRRANSTGFTLLELMVVIAIAGVLMALLLPALSNAKETSRRSVCNQNIHQIIIALLMYGNDNPEELLPSAVGNKGDYHSIVLSDATFTNLVYYMSGESNSLYCPNLVHATGTMGGYDPNFGYTIGYSYLAAAPLPNNVKGPDQGWTGPLKSSETGEVIADANYWTATSGQAMTVAPHTPGGGIAVSFFTVAGSSAAQSASTSPTAGATSAAMGAVGGNIGSLNGSVIWQTIRSMKEYQASTDGAWGNW